MQDRQTGPTASAAAADHQVVGHPFPSHPLDLGDASAGSDRTTPKPPASCRRCGNCSPGNSPWSRMRWRTIVKPARRLGGALGRVWRIAGDAPIAGRARNGDGWMPSRPRLRMAIHGRRRWNEAEYCAGMRLSDRKRVRHKPQTVSVGGQPARRPQALPPIPATDRVGWLAAVDRVWRWNPAQTRDNLLKCKARPPSRGQDAA